MMTNGEHGTLDTHDRALAGDVLHALRAIDGAISARRTAPAGSEAWLVSGLAGQSVQCRGVLATVGVTDIV
jgi:hypothetical protein